MKTELQFDQDPDNGDFIDVFIGDYDPVRDREALAHIELEREGHVHEVESVRIVQNEEGGLFIRVSMKLMQ